MKDWIKENYTKLQILFFCYDEKSGFL